MNNSFKEKLTISSLRGFDCEGSVIPRGADLDELIAAAELARARLLRPHFAEVIELMDGLPDRGKLLRAVELLHPWRKGPFRFGELEIDAEWRSDLKWERVLPVLSDLPLDGKLVADIGCGNGYYMFRLLELVRERGEKLGALIGFDPSEIFYLQFELLSRLFTESNAEPTCRYELLGLEELGPFAGRFDLVFLMGVIYHQRDPLAALSLLHSLVKPGGTAIVESIVIPGEGEDLLNPMEGPSGRYAKMRNVYWLPTVALLERTLREAGFSRVELVSCVVTDTTEQRRTPFMRFESLADFLDPANAELTVEGYPRPRRAVVRAVVGP